MALRNIVELSDTAELVICGVLLVSFCVAFLIHLFNVHAQGQRDKRRQRASQGQTIAGLEDRLREDRLRSAIFHGTPRNFFLEEAYRRELANDINELYRNRRGRP